MVLWLKTNNYTFKCDIHLTVRVCTIKRFFSEHVFIKISHCVFKIMLRKMKKKNYKFLNLCGLSTENFLAIWPSQYKFLSYNKKGVFILLILVGAGLPLCVVVTLS